ncbi:MAG TPA: signal peptide peptidase SppA [Candidatus Nanoarchaeia archaeon]|nr:signal peptide peptidase SppA [Candidatus Nanoarchaeia archaeon]
MKKRKDRGIARFIFLGIGIFLLLVFVIIPIISSFFSQYNLGNVALIQIKGVISSETGSMLGSATVSSSEIIEFIEDADNNEQFKVILLEINSPGGSAVASDEIAAAVKRTSKPVVAIIREMGASGGYWIASAADYVMANRMSITGSIGVISSYLEFSGLMEDYGVGYERLVAGENKDMGTPYQKLNPAQQKLMQGKLDQIHDFFIQEVAENRQMDIVEVQNLATGEFYLGVEALNLGLVDSLGDKDAITKYLQQTYSLEEVSYYLYQRPVGLLDILSSVLSDLSFKVGEGLGVSLMNSNNLYNSNSNLGIAIST